MFGWTRKTTSTKSQTTRTFRPTLDGFEERLAPATLQGLGAAAQFAVLDPSKLAANDPRHPQSVRRER